MFSFKKIMNIFKFNKFRNISYSFAEPDVPGFSYLNLFKEEIHDSAAESLKYSPKIKKVMLFAYKNKKFLYQNKIKPTRFDDIELFDIEIGEFSVRPIKRVVEWGDEGEDETMDEYNERIRLWEIESKKWFNVKGFLSIAYNNYPNYRFQ